MIRIDAVSCRVGGLRDVSLAARLGEMLVLAGPNGAGKSTLLSLVAGERQPSEGVVRLDEMPVHLLRTDERARRIGVLPQASSLAFPFRVEEVVALGRLPFRGEPSDDGAIVRRAMREADVAHLAGRAYPTLSGGERQRVHLARVLAQLAGRKGWLLLDEPTASLDPAQQHAVLQVARERAREGCGVIAVLHDLNLVGRYADQVALLQRGRLLACGATAEVLTAANLAACYGIEATVIPHPRLGCPLVVQG